MKRTLITSVAIAALSLATRSAGAQPTLTENADRAALAAQVHAERVAPLLDTREIEFAHRGFMATRIDPKISNTQGRVVYDLSALDFLKGDAPATVNPSLWRQSQLVALHGLFQVSDNVWQVRGFDAANATFVKGDHGWIVIDTLGSVETAKAALDLVNETLGNRPIVAILYTHPHTDHFGGAGGMVSFQGGNNSQVQIIAPKGFLAAATRENVIAGPAMGRRAAYQFGFALAKSPTGQVGLGAAPGGASGTPSLIPPTREIGQTGESLVIDGVHMVFQLTRNTEAPVEFNIYFPEWRIVHMAENANTSQHNILPPRGAVIRDAKAWADDLTESIQMFGSSDTLITGHGWPRFGQAHINEYLSKQRDYYAFLHDQTVRLLNDGLAGDEIAARLKLPPELQKEWYNQPFYGSLSFNIRAVYQYYMGWYDANPVHLAPMIPEEAGRKYVAAMGGAVHVRDLANSAFQAGDYTWAAELLNRVVFANAEDVEAKSLLARCYERLGWASENAVWRNIYLSGAKELRDGPPRAFQQGGSSSFFASLSTSDVFDVLATRLDDEKASSVDLKLEVIFPERGERTYVTVRNGVLIHQPINAPGPVDATLTLSRADFLARVLDGLPLPASTAGDRGGAKGNLAPLDRLAGLLEAPKANFAIVTPHR